MMRMLLVRGLLAGLVAGLLVLVFAYVFGEPSVSAAIELEPAHHAAEPELVSRTVQSTAGLAVGVVVYSVAFGGLFAVAYAVAHGRLGNLGPRATAAVLALGGYLAVFVVPFLKYPPMPPGTGSEDTVGERTAGYFALVLASVLLAVAATYLGRRLTARMGGWQAGAVAILSFAVATGILGALFPPEGTIPPGFPADLLWDFRIAALGTQLVMWAAIGWLFGTLVHRHAPRAGSTAPAY